MGAKKNISTKNQPKPTLRATHKAKTQIVENFFKRHKKSRSFKRLFGILGMMERNCLEGCKAT